MLKYKIVRFLMRLSDRWLDIHSIWGCITHKLWESTHWSEEWKVSHISIPGCEMIPGTVN